MLNFHLVPSVDIMADDDRRRFSGKEKANNLTNQEPSTTGESEITMRTTRFENSGVAIGTIARVVGHDLSDSSTTELKKRPRDGAIDEIEIKEEEFSKMSRSERKRHREKKRRSDVNKGFDDLTALLIEIDPEVRAETQERAKRGQFNGKINDGVPQQQEENVLSRVDLISRTAEVLRRVHRENEERKQIIASLVDGKSPRTAAGIGTNPVTKTTNESLQHLGYTGPTEQALIGGVMSQTSNPTRLVDNAGRVSNSVVNSSFHATCSKKILKSIIFL